MTGQKPFLISEREYDVLGAVAQGLSDKLIAQSLGLSVKTVSTYTFSIYEKMDLPTMAEGFNRRVLAAALFAAGRVAMVRRSVVDIASPIPVGQSHQSLTAQSQLTSAAAAPVSQRAHVPADGSPAVGRVSHSAIRQQSVPGMRPSPVVGRAVDAESQDRMRLLPNPISGANQ